MKKIYSFLLSTLILLVFNACQDFEVPEYQGEVNFSLDNVQFSNTAAPNARIETNSTWKHIYKPNAVLNITHTASGKEYTLDYNPNTFGTFSRTLPYGAYTFESTVAGGVFEDYLPYTTSGEFRLESEKLDIKLTATTEYGLISVKNQSVSEAKVTAGTTTRNLKLLDDKTYYYIYVKAQTSTALAITETVFGTTINRTISMLAYKHFNYIIDLKQGNLNIIDLVLDPFGYEEEVINWNNLFGDSSPVPLNGLVAWYPFNGNANDESGNGFNGVIENAVLTTDRYGNPNKAFEFSSNVENNIEIDISSKYPTGISSSFSLLFWIKPNREVKSVTDNSSCNGVVTVPMAYSNQNWAFIPYWGGKTSLGVGLSMGTNGIFVANHGENILVSRASIPGQFNGFYCIILAQNGNDLNVYLDGKLVRKVTNSCTISPKVIGNIFSLGGSLYSPTFSGVIDEFAIWNRTITEEEALKINNGEKFK